MVEKGLTETKMDERIGWSIEMIKKHAKDNNLDFDKDLFLMSCEIAKTLFVRSEIAYSGRKG